MNTLGWILYCVLCVLACAGTIYFLSKKRRNIVATIITVVLALGICVGGYFGAHALFPNKVEEPTPAPVVEEQVTITEAEPNT